MEILSTAYDVIRSWHCPTSNDATDPKELLHRVESAQKCMTLKLREKSRTTTNDSCDTFLVIVKIMVRKADELIHLPQ